jgi:PadR family transcriptional regulator AphA
MAALLGYTPVVMVSLGVSDGDGGGVKRLTTTSYALLGLLAIRPWTTYELAKQMAVSLRNFWPRAESRVYEEPKKLVAHGLATVTRDHVGRRPRSTYRITDDGRAALRRWLGEPGEMPLVEFEALVKVFFAEHGSKDDALATLRSVREQAAERLSVDARWAGHYLAGRAQFPERAPIASVVGRLQAELDRAVAQWADWAEATVAGWPDDLRTAPLPREALAEIAGWASPAPGDEPPPKPRPAPRRRQRSYSDQSSGLAST